MKRFIFIQLIALNIICFGQTEYSKINLSVDFSAEPVVYNNYWNSTGFTPGALIFRNDMLQTLDEIASVPNKGVKYVRPHWLLNLVGSKHIGTPNPEFNYEKLDMVLDELVSRELKPIFEIMGYPSLTWEVTDNENEKALKGIKSKQWVPDFNNISDAKQWHQFIIGLTEHLEERYGEEELKTWYFECFNEPNVVKYFWMQGIPALLNYWDASSEAIKEVNSEYKVGGPGTAGSISDSFNSFIAHCDTGMNIITNKRGAPLDFISVHIKQRPYQMIDGENESVNYIRQFHPKFKDLPFWNDEADPMAGWGRRYWWRADAWYGAFIVHSVDAHNRLSIDSMGITFDILSNDNGFLGDWYKRTHFARMTNPENSDHYWLIKQPSFTVMSLLAHCTGERYEVAGYQSTRENTLLIPAKNPDGTVVLLLANKPEFGSVQNNGNVLQHPVVEQRRRIMNQGSIVNVAIKNLTIENPHYTIIRVDNLHGNAYSEWNNLGQPDPVSLEQYSLIASNQNPVITHSSKWPADGKLSIQMPPSSVAMIVVSSDESTKTQCEIISINEYAGYNGERTNYIRWKQAEGVTVYNVYASVNGGALSRINPQELFDCGFLYVLPKDAEKIDYVVESRKL